VSLTIAQLEAQAARALDQVAVPGDAEWDLEHYTRIGRMRAFPFTEEDLDTMFEDVPPDTL